MFQSGTSFLFLLQSLPKKKTHRKLRGLLYISYLCNLLRLHILNPPHTRQLILEPDKMFHSCLTHPCWVFSLFGQHVAGEEEEIGEARPGYEGLLTVDLPTMVRKK